MVQMLSEKKIKWNLYNLFFSSIFFIASFLYVWLKINPLLYYQNQEPIFFFGSRFFHKFLSYPGGLAEYVSAFLSQFYYIPWAGTLVVILLLIFISMTTLGMLKKLGRKQPLIIAHLIPAAFLLILHNYYDHELIITFSLLISLMATFLFLAFNFQKPILRLLVFTLSAVLLHYLLAGPFFLFVLLVALAEMVYFKRYILPILYIIIAVIIPYLSASYFLLTSIKDSYLNFLAFQYSYSYKIIPYLLYLCFIVLVFWPKIYTTLVAVPSTENKIFKMYGQLKTRIPTFLRVTIPALVLLGGTFIILSLSFNNYIQKLLLIDYYNRHENWSQVLKVCEKNVLNNKLTAFHINRALYHTGQLGELMFAYPQMFGVENLISARDFALGSPLDRSDLYFDFGHVNEAEHWAIEAVASKGYTAYNLQRLALAKMLKGDYEASRKCLLNLKKNFLFDRWADKYLNYIKDTTLISKDGQLNEIRSYMVEKDFIVDMDHPEFDMERYLEFNKNNKMAYELLMAYYLLSGELLDFIKNIDRLKDFHYRKMPRHYEEAIAVYMSVTKREERISQLKISIKTFRDFQNFQKILKKYNNDKAAAQNEIMSKFGNSYWAYLIYTKPEKP
jgi:hypothetical protein